MRLSTHALSGMDSSVHLEGVHGHRWPHPRARDGLEKLEDRRVGDPLRATRRACYPSPYLVVYLGESCTRCTGLCGANPGDSARRAVSWVRTSQNLTSGHLSSLLLACVGARGSVVGVDVNPDVSSSRAWVRGDKGSIYASSSRLLLACVGASIAGHSRRSARRSPPRVRGCEAITRDAVMELRVSSSRAWVRGHHPRRRDGAPRLLLACVGASLSPWSASRSWIALAISGFLRSSLPVT